MCSAIVVSCVGNDWRGWQAEMADVACSNKDCNECYQIACRQGSLGGKKYRGSSQDRSELKVSHDPQY